MSSVAYRCGADPEVFLLKDGEHHSVIGYIGANKWHPMQIPDLPTGFTLQEDNVALEYGVPPAATEQEFVDNITTVMEKSREYLPKGIEFSNLSCVIYKHAELRHPAAHVFGCEPDYNAWTRKANPRPKAVNPNMRSAGGHVHIETTLPAGKVARACDLYLGIPSLLMDAAGAERRQLYGNPGAHRKKSYGVEYRTLSNFWIFKPELIRWVWRNVGRALEHKEAIPNVVRNCIQQNDIQLAKTLIKEYGLEVV